MCYGKPDRNPSSAQTESGRVYRHGLKGRSPYQTAAGAEEARRRAEERKQWLLGK